MKLKSTIFIGLITLLSSCVINKPITYKTKDIQKNADQKLSEFILDVEVFSDKRKDSTSNQILFTNPKQCKIDGKQTCINSESHYKKSPATVQLTNMFVQHLKARTAFKNVYVNKKDTADFYISGNLTKLYGKQGFSTAAAVGAQFGLIGAVATAGAKTKGQIIFEITDLKIYNRKNEIIKNIGTYRKVYEDDFHADAYCWCIYDNINLKLKEYFTELITEVESSIRSTNR
jgi:hypothetical protein